MSNTWVFIMAVMILGNFILQMLPTSVFIPGVINILVDLNIMSQSLSWIAFGALLMWSMLGGGSSKND